MTPEEEKYEKEQRERNNKFNLRVEAYYDRLLVRLRDWQSETSDVACVKAYDRAIHILKRYRHSY